MVSYNGLSFESSVFIIFLFSLLTLYEFIGFVFWRRQLVSQVHARTFFPAAQNVRLLVRLLSIIVGLIGLLGVLLRPAWGELEESLTSEHRDVVVMLDISRSMQAADLAPTRLDLAKMKVRDLIHQFSCERVGLVLFSGTAFIQVPLTKDLKAFEQFLAQVDVEMIASGTTALDQALEKMLQLFSGQEFASSRIGLLVTDGEDFSTQFDTTLKRIKEQGVTVITYGVGTEEGAPIPKKDERGKIIGYEQDDHGGVALSRLNRAHLEHIADELSGSFVPVTKGVHDIEQIIKQVEALDTYHIDQVQKSTAQSRTHWFAVLAASAWLVEALL